MSRNPARTTPASGLILLPEVFNTNDHIRAVVDGYAEAGFVVIAPDVYWRQEPGQYLSYTDEGREKAQALRAELDTDQFTADLGDVAAALRARADCTGKIGIMGFCLGGKFTYLACTRLPVDAGVSYYGVQIDAHLDEADDLKCPLLMHFASDDPHVTPQTVAAIRARMGDRDTVEIVVHPGTEHGFNRFGYPCYNESAAATAREATLAHFRRLLA
jgi:carboxymethylenebutenolidase